MPDEPLTHGRPLSVEELDRVLVAADPRAVLVRPRVLRRIIKRTRRVRGALSQMPHRRVFLVGRQLARDAASDAELGISGRDDVPETLILLERPTRSALARIPRPEALVEWWRLLFHGRVHAALVDGRPGGLPSAFVHEQIDRIGQTAFDEIRSVLAGEELLFRGRTEGEEFVEFAAMFLELRLFTPELIPRYFPGLVGREEEISAQLGEIIDPLALRDGACPEGAPNPLLVQRTMPAPTVPRGRRQRRGPRTGGLRSLSRRADRASLRGNGVRAAILRQRLHAGDRVGPAPTVAPEALEEIDRLVRRLKGALAIDANEARRWNHLLRRVLPRAATGFRGPEGRLLYDLQKVCVDHERGAERVDLVGWVLGFGRRPLRRPLPHAREVLMCRHLRRAAARLVAVDLPPTERDALGGLVEGARHLAEGRLRKRCRPDVVDALDAAGLRPTTVAEAVARDKLAEELVDRIVERGFFSLGDVRDALSRNQLKLCDCRSVSDFWSADDLLDLDRDLRRRLDGIYHGGEVYLRWLQRISAAVFGTRTGRALTRVVAIPFGAAFVILEGLQHLVGPAVAAVFDVNVRLVDARGISVIALGLYFLALLHSAAARRISLRVLRRFGLGLRVVFWTWPRRLVATRWLQRAIRSRPFRWFLRFILRPALWTIAVGLTLFVLGVEGERLLFLIGAAFVAFEVLFNSPVGLTLEEWGVDWGVRVWERFRGTFLVGLFRLVVNAFQTVMDLLERALYVVDEWLRFRAGEGRVSLAAKAVLGVIWGGMTWLIRLYTNLLIEPQVNPVKHFPVVTVSHKLMLGYLPLMIGYGNAVLSPALGPVIANAISWTTVTLLPGFFGFLVWELKENWRLYGANRPVALQPSVVGSHGETVGRLMRPGFHSGTLPKAFARLRGAEQKSLWTGNAKPVRKQRAVIHHVEEAVGRWIERDLCRLLELAPAWRRPTPMVVAVRASSNALSVLLGTDDAAPLNLRFEEQSGWIVAGIGDPGWLPGLDDEARATLRHGVLGLYKSAGVDLIREELESALGDPVPPYDIADIGLLIWPGKGYREQSVLPLEPHLFSRRPMPWKAWVAVWEVTPGPSFPLLEHVPVLPARSDGWKGDLRSGPVRP